jgi:hypothetical protein
MKPKPTTPKPSVEATTTVKVRIKDKEFTLTKEEAQVLAKSLVDAVGLPQAAHKSPDGSLNEQFDRLRKAKEEYEKQRPIFPSRPYRPDPWDVPQWPAVPKFVWTSTEAYPTLDTSKFPPGTLLRQS